MGLVTVHVSGNRIYTNTYAREAQSCIVVRPEATRDTKAFLVNEVKFTGPSSVHFALARLSDGNGFQGMLPGFNRKVQVYLTAEERDTMIQPIAGASFIPLEDFVRLQEAGEFNVPTLNPSTEPEC